MVWESDEVLAFEKGRLVCDFDGFEKGVQAEVVGFNGVKEGHVVVFAAEDVKLLLNLHRTSIFSVLI